MGISSVWRWFMDGPAITRRITDGPPVHALEAEGETMANEFEAVAKTRTGWNRPIGVYATQDEADKAAYDFAVGEGCDTMVRPVRKSSVPA